MCIRDRYVVPQTLNKGTAVDRLREKLKPEFVIAAGDSTFDIPMLSTAEMCIRDRPYHGQVPGGEFPGQNGNGCLPCGEGTGYVNVSGYRHVPEDVYKRQQYETACRKLAETVIAETGVKQGERVLVISTEEFMYPALLTGQEIEKIGCDAVSYTHLPLWNRFYRVSAAPGADGDRDLGTAWGNGV